MKLTFSLQIVWITSSGGVPKSSVIIENWFTSAQNQVNTRQTQQQSTHGPFQGTKACPRASPRKYSPCSKCPLHPRCQYVTTEMSPHTAPHRVRDRYGRPKRGLTGNVILLPCQHDLRRSVVPRRDISSHLGVLESQVSVAHPGTLSLRGDFGMPWRAKRSCDIIQPSIQP